MSPVLLEAGGLLKVGGQLLGLLRLDVELGAARFFGVLFALTILRFFGFRLQGLQGCWLLVKTCKV